MVQLAAADIHGVDALGPAGQAHLGEAAGRGADVQHHLVLGRDEPVRQGVGQLQRAAADPGMGRLGLYPRILRGEFGRLEHRLAIDAHAPSLDRGLGLGAALEEAAFDEEDVNALFAHVA